MIIVWKLLKCEEIIKGQIWEWSSNYGMIGTKSWNRADLYYLPMCFARIRTLSVSETSRHTFSSTLIFHELQRIVWWYKQVDFQFNLNVSRTTESFMMMKQLHFQLNLYSINYRKFYDDTRRHMFNSTFMFHEQKRDKWWYKQVHFQFNLYVPWTEESCMMIQANIFSVQPWCRMNYSKVYNDASEHIFRSTLVLDELQIIAWIQNTLLSLLHSQREVSTFKLFINE